jgi:hypothetical protein
MGENIVTNELLANGFLVTHLDKGTRGVSANADLLVGHDSLDKPVLIQVKSCFSERFDQAFLGAFHSGDRLFNLKPGFKADFIASVIVKSPTEYKVFVLEVKTIERLLVEAFGRFHARPKLSGESRKEVSKMYVPLADRKTICGGAFIEVARAIRDSENNFKQLFGESESAARGATRGTGHAELRGER